MLRYRDGDAGAFEVLYRRHRGGLYRYLLRLCGRPAAAEEMFQDVWLNLIRARSRYTVEARFATYLYRLAHNRLIDHYRRELKGVPLSFEDDCPVLESAPAARGDEPEARLAGKQAVARLAALLEALPEAQREAFLLHEEADMSVDEIAAATGVNRETAKSRLRYALDKLQRGMEDLL